MLSIFLLTLDVISSKCLTTKICENGGECIVTKSGFDCKCTNMFTGIRCHTSIGVTYSDAIRSWYMTERKLIIKQFYIYKNIKFIISEYLIK